MVTTVLTEVPHAIPLLAERFPDVTFIDISTDCGEDVTGDILFGGIGPHTATVVDRGVKWVQLPFTGIDHAPPDSLRAQTVTAAKGAGAIPISEYVMSALLACSRDFPANWLREAPERWNYQRTTALHGQTLSLIGFGGIAQRVARLAAAFDMKILATRRHASHGVVDGVQLVESVDELLAPAHHLVVCAPLTPETHHLLNDERFTKVTPGLHVVNIARGAIIDQDALRRALDDGRVARASLDVTDPEPLPAGHWLYEHPRVFLTPHSSWTGTPFFSGAIDIFADNLERYLAGQPLVGVIDRELGY